MVLKVGKDTRIIWLLVVLVLLQQYILAEEQFLALSAITIVFICIYCRKMIIPKIAGIRPYILMLLFISVMGLIKYSTYLVFRDVFYQWWTVIAMIIGYMLYSAYGDTTKSIWSTIVLVAFIISLVCLIKGFIGQVGQFDFITLRTAFGTGSRTISIVLPLLVYKRIFVKEHTLSPVLDIIVILTWSAQLLLNFSRTALLNMVICMVVIFICLVTKREISVSAFARMLVVVIILIIAGTQMVALFPDDVKDEFGGKVENSFNEIDSENEYKNLKDVQDNWRGYEISCAQKQWKNADLPAQFFGSGNGSLVSIKYVPHSWKETVEYQDGKPGITVLHNTYYTMLTKGGILFLLIYLWLLIQNIRVAIKLMKREEYNFEGIALLCIVVYMIVDGYVIGAMMQRGEDISPYIMLGWFNALYINKIKYNDDEPEVDAVIEA